MKKLILISGLFLFITSSCFKNENLINAEVVRDCTGTYMHMNNQDYLVCNQEKVKSFETGAQVKIAFNKLETCNDPDSPITCLMLHANAGWIQVTKIK